MSHWIKSAVILKERKDSGSGYVFQCTDGVGLSIRKTGRDISRWSVEMVFSMGEKPLPQETYDLTKSCLDFLPVRSYGK